MPCDGSQGALAAILPHRQSVDAPRICRSSLLLAGAARAEHMGHGRVVRKGYIEDETPILGQHQVIARISEVRGKGIVGVAVLAGPVGDPCDCAGSLVPSLAYLPPRFRNVLFLRRGAFLIVSPRPSSQGEEDKVAWTIDTVLRTDDVKQMKKDGTWPSHFDTVARPTDVCLAPLEGKISSSSEEEEEEEEDEEEEEERKGKKEEEKKEEEKKEEEKKGKKEEEKKASCEEQ